MLKSRKKNYRQTHQAICNASNSSSVMHRQFLHTALHTYNQGDQMSFYIHTVFFVKINENLLPWKTLATFVIFKKLPK
jgi:hypothetical protein